MIQKCKDQNHVDAVGSTATGGDKPGVWTVVRVAHGACRNIPGYNDALYVLTKNGKPGLQMLPSLAAVLPGELRASQHSASVVIRHTVAKLKVQYALLTPPAAVALADLIDAATP